MELQGEFATQHNGRRYCVTKSIINTEIPDTISSTSRYDALLELPDPSKLRNAAGVVTRRTDRRESAEAPPGPPQSRTIWPRTAQAQRKKKGGAGFGDSSDSDSDDDKPKRNRGGESRKPVIQRRKFPGMQPGGLPSSSVSQLSAEEEQRLEQLRTLRAVKDNWAAIDKRRQHYNNMRQKIETELIHTMRQGPFESPEIPKGVLDCNIRLREQLEEILYGTIRKIPQHGTSTESNDLEEIVEQIEKRMVAWCHDFDAYHFSGLPTNVRLAAVLQACEKSFWKYMFLDEYTWPTTRDEECYIIAQEYVTGACRDYMEKHGQQPGIVSGRETFIDVLLSQYKRKVMDAMCAAVPHIISETQFKQGPEGLWQQSIRDSRVGGRLTPSYVQWVTADVCPTQLNRFCEEWHRVKREEALRGFRASAGTKIEQVFCPDISKPGVVSLVLVKGDHLAEVRDIPAKDLWSMGWFHETMNGQIRYWRCEPGNYDGWGMANDIFKVDMDGRVLGAFCYHNSAWALLECDDYGKLTPRPLSSVEAAALSWDS
ncbi:hypothetical protein SLS62_002168 [Diatrype stigma]|uniref:Uncharacterized protein n=1 Tax=Diatrype stigma TaxID=117547 RepID=A0AAN9UYF6_9PEZI